MNEFEIFEKYLSTPRIGRYMLAKNLDKELCVNLYKSNLNICKSFHPIIGVFEVVLRNEIDKIFSNYFNDEDWIINQQTSFMIDPSLSYIDNQTGKIVNNRFILNSVKTVTEKLNKKGIKITSNKVLSEQSLSFWTEMFEKNYYKVLKGKPIQIFKFLPSKVNRVEVLNILNQIRKFRNRINHNEPICFYKNTVNLQLPLHIYESIIQLLNWINPETHILLNDIDEVYLSINLAKNELS